MGLNYLLFYKYLSMKFVSSFGKGYFDCCLIKNYHKIAEFMSRNGCKVCFSANFRISDFLKPTVDETVL